MRYHPGSQKKSRQIAPNLRFIRNFCRGSYEIFAFYWTATAISTRKYPVPFDPGSQAGKSPPSTAVREKEYLQRRSRWRYSQLDFQYRTGPPPIRIPIFANQSRLKSKTYLDSPESVQTPHLVKTWEHRGAVGFLDQISSFFSHFFTFFVIFCPKDA